MASGTIINNRQGFHGFGTPVDLTAYSNSNPYIAPTDGYIKCYAIPTTGAWGDAVIHDGTQYVQIRAIGVTGAQSGMSSLYCKKGSRLYGTHDSLPGTTSSAQFFPLN